VSTEEALIFLHLLGAFWYVMGLTSVQISLVRSWDRENPSARADSIEEASHYQGILLVPGAIAAVSTGVFLWALDYNLITTPWLVIVEALFAVTLLICLPLTGAGIRRARTAALRARRAGKSTPELDAAMSDPVPMVLLGVATAIVPVVAALSVFKPF
jgi:uncharacterized membrane protein